MNITSCAALDARLADYLGAELSPAQRAECDAHLAACAHCRAMVSQLSDAQAHIRAAGGPLELAEARAAAAHAPSAHLHTRPRPRAAPLLAMAAALLAAFSAGFLTGRPSPVSPAAPASTPPISPVPSARAPQPATLPRVAQDYLKAAKSAPGASTFGWSLLSVARRS